MEAIPSGGLDYFVVQAREARRKRIIQPPRADRFLLPAATRVARALRAREGIVARSATATYRSRCACVIPNRCTAARKEFPLRLRQGLGVFGHGHGAGWRHGIVLVVVV